MKKTPNPRCKTIKPDGTQCGAYSIGEHGYCISCARKNGLYIDKPKPVTVREVDDDDIVIKPGAPRRDDSNTILLPTRPTMDDTIVVAEPVALTALREQTAQEIDRKPVDPVDKVAVVNQIRQLLGMLGLTGEEVSALVGANSEFQRGDRKLDASRQRLVDRARAMGESTPPESKAIAEQKAMEDVRRVATSLRAQKAMTAARLKSEPWIEVQGGELPEDFSINGVPFTVPANGLYRVPRTIANMLSERRYRRMEKMEKSRLMSADHPLEMGELNRRMREVEQRFGSITVSEGQEFDLAAEEIKPR